MAAIYPSSSDQEQSQRTNQNSSGASQDVGDEPAVGIYERPQRRFSVAGAVLLIIVLLLVAYFVMQWIF
jgi:lipopolysaccharide/colanic/teichoic acid biosynthesis glycosyltransferase